ncbi:DUF1963 domain-containing protein [Tropicibacter naphthalenivorans]|uniref:DUF1963 domain-containing protein n=1 Tax=Tropicibacter naphthalenivorans TaxID=441103 RepID=A0A0P1GZ83_9RHOB|nr:DUF1963 domain-containing protein [Tropicibacter naphthalenivorans]CUH79059.1 hypothetical protein TRN7648_02302 [Tropicibacter naphthalenivorans]SMD03696.1 protein of unknown function [Tropicibacter naphthalenivorans]
MTSRESANRQFTPEETAHLFELATHPALLLTKTEFQGLEGAPGCWLGGFPTLPFYIDWPWVERDGAPLVPMHFMAQIRLDSLPLGDDFAPIPRQGTLFFFANYCEHQEGQTGSVSVIHVTQDVSACPERAMPPFPEDFWDEVDLCGWFDEPEPFRKWPVTVRKFDSLNSEFSQNAGWQQKAWKRGSEIYQTLFETPVTAPGNPALKAPRQGGVVHTMFDFLGDRDRDLMRDRQIPLLRLEIDRDWGFEYGHYLGFYIPPEALKAHDFSQAFACTLT